MAVKEIVRKSAVALAPRRAVHDRELRDCRQAGPYTNFLQPQTSKTQGDGTVEYSFT
jgi:hypothetical protein